MTRSFAAFRLLCLIAGTCAYTNYGLEFMTSSPAYEVWAWWWRHGEGKVPILLCLTALLAFPLLKAAAAMLRDMASFDSANVSGPV